MEIHELSRPVSREEDKSFHFGVEPSKVAVKLRELADSIDAKDIAVTETVIYARGQIDEFAIQTFILKFAERREPCEPKIKELRGAGEMFPVAVAKTE